MAVIDDRVEHEIRIQAPLEVVFTYLTDPDKHSAWMGQQVTLDPRPGGIYRCVMHNYATVTGEYVTVDPPHRVVFTWGFEGDETIPRGSSTVEVTLTPDGSGTVLRLVHTGLPHPALALHDKGWHGYLGQLAAVATSC
jgi:uncharacterized protein YndB with AHSA1/START domain